MTHFIKSINWIFTYKCNLKCNHCDIWSYDYKSELSIEKIKEIVNSKIIQNSYKYYGEYFDIGLSGGEPLLIENLEEKMLLIDEYLPNSIHSISTNGILTNKLMKLLIFWKKKGKSFKKINISVDGKQINHDRQRGVDGSFLKILETIGKIKKVFPEQIIELKMTITKNNYRDIIFLCRLANKLGVNFSFKPVENMTNYTNQKNYYNGHFSEDEIIEIENQVYDNPYIIEQGDYINKNFFYKIPDYLRNGLGEEKKNCNIAKDSITIMPDGKVFSCILMNKIGDLRENNIDEIWNGKNIKLQRKLIENGDCPECMLMCGAFKSKEIYDR
ncbi:MAG: radical SAM protein [Candidatus Gracilibacteria bacterium]|nr:radical SAM protein [Candidatus Gracilibacteria bacterium]